MAARSARSNGAAGHVSLLKMCVGIDRVPELLAWQARRLEERRRRKQPLELYHRTMQVPKRAAEIVAGGSLYWVIKGYIRVRQRIDRIDVLEPPVEGKRCVLVLGPELVRTALQARRPHQGWRYLEAKDAPADLPGGIEATDDLPPELMAELRALGLL
jgi:hypothetical protein